MAEDKKAAKDSEKTAAQVASNAKTSTNEAEAEVAAKKKKPTYYVAPGHAITSKKGILSGDNEAEVKAEFLEGGEATIKAFIETGHILKG